MINIPELSILSKLFYNLDIGIKLYQDRSGELIANVSTSLVMEFVNTATSFIMMSINVLDTLTRPDMAWQLY
mgnify:CR=1 FL=1